jgi:hypothetical protein
MLKTNGRGRLVTSSATKTKNKAEMLKAESRNEGGRKAKLKRGDLKPETGRGRSGGALGIFRGEFGVDLRRRFAILPIP